MTLAIRIRDYFKALFKGSEAGVELVYHTYEACGDILQEERLVAYVLIQYSTAGREVENYIGDINIFAKRFKDRVDISKDVAIDILKSALYYFDTPIYTNVAPTIAELRRYVKKSIETNEVLTHADRPYSSLKEGKVPSVSELWEQLLRVSYDNKYLQGEHEKLIGVVSSQFNINRPKSTVIPRVIRLIPEETVRPAMPTLPLPGEGIPRPVTSPPLPHGELPAVETTNSLPPRIMLPNGDIVDI